MLALVRNGSHRMTSHQAVLRLVMKMEQKRQAGVELRKVGFWPRDTIERQLQVW